jgi:hypothetical protein
VLVAAFAIAAAAHFVGSSAMVFAAMEHLASAVSSSTVP